MKTKLLSALVTGLAASLVFIPAIYAANYPGHQYSKEAQVSLMQARETALKTFPGRIVSEELEHEKGGSGLRYSFDIRHGKLVHEVGIDAKTGKVLENSDDSHDSD